MTRGTRPGHWSTRARADVYNDYYARIYQRLHRCPTCTMRLRTTTGYCSDACAASAEDPPDAHHPQSPHPAVDPLPDTIPYAMPTAAPFNVPTPTTTPTYDGTGHGFHPSVWDAGVGERWNGFRYWMAMTPFHGGDEDLENPCILASHDGFDWQVPPGLTNPLARRGSAPGFDYNSDTELVFLPEEGTNGTLYCFWRPANRFAAPIDEAWYYATSTDGITWSAQHRAGAWFGVEPSYASPSLVRIGDTEWRAFTNAGVLTSRHPSGPWSRLAPYRNVGLARRRWWHHDVELVDGRFWAIITNGSTEVWPAVSRDGVHWVHGASMLARPPAHAWEAGGYYRPAFLPHPDGATMNVWYSGYDLDDPALDRRIGFTQISCREWRRLRCR